jgi:hypothetical protein
MNLGYRTMHILYYWLWSCEYYFYSVLLYPKRVQEKLFLNPGRSSILKQADPCCILLTA